MVRLSNEQLEAIRNRVEKATEGPWLAEYQDVKTEGVLGGKYGEPEIIAEVIYSEENDADFIAHAREDVPALLAEIERLYADNEYLRMKNELNAHILQHYRGYM